MCNLYTLRESQRQILGQAFDFGSPRYKIAPGTLAPLVRFNAGELEAVDLKWGFRPHWMSREWMRDKKRQPPINVRSETIHSSPMFRSAFRHQRCLVPADGFFEPNDAVKASGGKEFWFFERKDGEPFCFAGIWTSFGEGEAAFENFAMVTTEPEETVGAVHRRMPAMLRSADQETWMNPELEDAETLKGVLQPYNAEPLTGHVVSPDVYKMRWDDPGVIQAHG